MLYQTAAVYMRKCIYRGKSEHWHGSLRKQSVYLYTACRRVAGNARPEQSARCEQRRLHLKRCGYPKAILDKPARQRAGCNG